MTARPKTGGRKAGTPNTKTKSIIERLKELKCDPIEGMAIIAKQAMDKGEMQLAGNMYKELAQYVAPKRKSVEITGEDCEDIKIDGKFVIEIVRPD